MIIFVRTYYMLLTVLDTNDIRNKTSPTLILEFILQYDIVRETENKQQ